MGKVDYYYCMVCGRKYEEAQIEKLRFEWYCPCCNSNIDYLNVVFQEIEKGLSK